MKNKNYFFNKAKVLPIDKFFDKVLFDKKHGYYSSKAPFGYKGDFLTAPGISNLFPEIIGVWLVSTWISFGKPKKFNFVELGPGDGELTKNLIKTFNNFPDFNKAVRIFLYEKSRLLKDLQKKRMFGSKIQWIKNFDKIKSGPVVFFGNEFFDSIPIKQFLRKNKFLYEKNYCLDKSGKINEIYKKSKKNDYSLLKKFNSLNNLNFIEFPKLGFKELDKITKKISQLSGGILLIDYGYNVPNNKNTLQSLMNHKKNNLLHNLGKADITSLVNFSLLKEYFLKKNLRVKDIVSQKFFLEKMGIIQRANIISKKMKFKEKANLYLRLKRLLTKTSMGTLFKVIFAYKFYKNNFLGFE